MSDSNQNSENNSEIIRNSIPNSKSAFFVPTTLLFCLPLILLLNQISVTLKFPDFYSYVLLIIGGSLFARNYIVGFLTLNYAYLSHKWFIFAVNFAFVAVSFWTTYTAISDLSFNSYPEYWFINMAGANLIFLAQIWINKIYNSSYFQTQLIQIIFLMVGVGALWQRLFNGDRWFLSVLAIVVALFEIFLVVGVVKLVFNWERDREAENIDSDD